MLLQHRFIFQADNNVYFSDSLNSENEEPKEIKTTLRQNITWFVYSYFVPFQGSTTIHIFQQK